MSAQPKTDPEVRLSAVKSDGSTPASVIPQRAIPRAMLAALGNLERVLMAPVVPIFDAKGRLTGGQRVLPEEQELRAPELPGAEGLDRSRASPAMPPLPTPPEYHRTVLPSAVADQPVTMATFTAAMDTLVPQIQRDRQVIAVLQARMAEQDELIAQLESMLEEAAAEGPERLAALEARVAQAEARSASLESRAAQLERRADEAFDVGTRHEARIDRQENETVGLSDRIDRQAERVTHLANTSVSDIDFAARERRLIMAMTIGGEAKTREVKLDFPIERGIFQSGKAYEKGDLVTYAGSSFIATRDTRPPEKPEQGDAFRLMVKRGRDGKPGAL